MLATPKFEASDRSSGTGSPFDHLFLERFHCFFSFFFFFLLLNYRQYARKFREKSLKSLLFSFFFGSFYLSFPLQRISRVFFVILSFQVRYREIILIVISTILFANPRAISRIILSKGEMYLFWREFLTCHSLFYILFEKYNYESKDHCLVNRYSFKAHVL